MTPAQRDVLAWLEQQPWARGMSYLAVAEECRRAAHLYTMAPGDAYDGGRAKRMLARAAVLEQLATGVDPEPPVERPEPEWTVVPTPEPVKVERGRVEQLGLFGG